MKLQDLYEQRAEQYKSLNDASKIIPELKKGKTEIWYMKSENFRDFSGGPKFLEKIGKMPSKDDIKNTHILLGKIAENDPDNIMSIMQGEMWSPNGEANNLIRKLKLTHTSMSIGDVIKIGNKTLMVDSFGFKELK